MLHGTRRSNRKHLRSISGGLAGGLVTLMCVPALAGPKGEKVVHGSATFDRAGEVTRITTSQKAIINYQSFNIGAGETVQFIQPSADSRVLNRIKGPDPTRIDGTLLANGHVYIVNQAGVYFGQGALVDVGQFYAAAGNITNRDFLNGVDRFTLTGEVENHGKINAREHVALLGRNVSNFGVISVPDGTITMAVGDRVYLGQRGSSVLLDVSSKVRTEGGQVANAGELSASELIIGAGDMFAAVLFDQSYLTAQRITVEGGRGTTTVVRGTIDATNDQGVGGTVHLLGDRVGLYGATVDVSGATGGGTILIGGDYQGQGDVRTAVGTHVSRDTTLIADATVQGDGGTIITWADKGTSFYGTLSARGKGEGGNGGFAEVSGKESLMFLGQADLGAEQGQAGTILFDPVNIVIQDGSGAADDTFPDFSDGIILFDEKFGEDAFISEQFLESFTGSIVLQATNNITIQNLSDDVLSLQATSGLIEIIANADGVGGGAFLMDASDTIETQGAGIIIRGAGITTGGLTTNGGNIEVVSTTAVTVNGSYSTSGGNIQVTAGIGNNAVTFIGNIATAGGNVTIGAGNGITLGNGTDPFTMTTGGGFFSGNANTDNNTTGNYSITNGVSINTGGGNFIYSGANWTIGNSANINAGSGNVDIIVSRSVPVALGNASTGVNLTAAELARFTTSGTFSVGASGVAPTGMSVQNFDGATGITGDVVLNSSGTINFVTSQSDFRRGLSVTASAVNFDAGLGIEVGLSGVGDLVIDAGTIMLGGNVIANSAGLITMTGDVTLAANVNVTSVDSNILFGGAIDGDTLGPWNLSANAGTGDVTVVGPVGNSDTLDTFSLTGATVSVRSGVVTEGDQTYTGSNIIALGDTSGTATFTSTGTGTVTNGIVFDGVVELRGDVEVSTLGGTNADDILFMFSINGDGDGPWDLTLAAAGDGDITVSGDVGTSAALGQISVSGDEIGFQAVSAAGISQSAATSTTFAGDIQVGAGGVNLTGGAITFEGSIQASDDGDIILANSGTLDINKFISTGGAISQTGAGDVTIADLADLSATSIGFSGAVTLDGGSTLVMTASDGLSFGSTLDAADSALTLLVAGALQFGDAVSGTGSLDIRPSPTQSIGLGNGAVGDLTIDATSIANIQDGFSQVRIGTPSIGEHDFDITDITLNTLISFLAPAGGEIRIRGTLDASALTTGTLSITGSGSTTILSADIITGGADIFIDDSVVIDEGLSILLDSGGGFIEITGTVEGTTGGAAEALTLDAATGTVTIGGDISGSSGDVDATGLTTLTIVDASAVSLAGVAITGNLSTTNPLTGAFAATGNVTTGGLTVLATGFDITFGGSVDASGAITVDGAAIDFGGTVEGASLSATNTGALDFASTVTLDGGNFEQTGGGGISFGGSVSTDGGDILIDDAVSIVAGQTLSSGTGRQVYGSTITSAGALTFIANGDGVNAGLTFGGAVSGSGTVALRSASSSTSFEIGDSTTGNNVLIDNTGIGQLSGWSAVSVGYGGAATHSIEVGQATFEADTTIGAGTGTIFLLDDLVNTSAGGTFQLNSSTEIRAASGSSIQTNGGDVELNGGLFLGQGAQFVFTTGGGSVFISGDVFGTSGGSAENITFTLGTGDLEITGTLNGDGLGSLATGLVDVVINSARDVSIGSGSPNDAIAAIDIFGLLESTSRMTGEFTTNGRDVNAGSLNLVGTHMTFANINALSDVFLNNSGVLSIGAGLRGGDVHADGFFVQTNGLGTGTFILGGDIETAGSGSIAIGSPLTLLGDINDALGDSDDTFNDRNMNAFIVGNNAVVIDGAVDTNGFDLTISALSMAFNGGSGSIFGGDGQNIVRLLPADVNGTIDVGDVVGAGGVLQGGLHIRTQEISALDEGFFAIQIGFAGSGEHSIQIGTATFADAVEFHAPVAGGVTVLGLLTSTDDQADNDRAVFIDGSGATTTLANNIVTAGGDIIIDDSVVIAEAANITLDSGGGFIQITGSIEGTNGGAAERLNFEAGTGAIEVGGAISGSSGFADDTGLTIVDFASAGGGVSIQSVNIDDALLAGGTSRIGGLFTTNGQAIDVGIADLVVHNADFDAIGAKGGDFVIDNSGLLRLGGLVSNVGGGFLQNDILGTGSVELGGDISTHLAPGDVRFTSGVTVVGGDRSIDAGEAGIDILSTFNADTFDMTFTGNRVDLNGGVGSVTGSGVLTIRQADDTTDLDIGNIVGAGGTPGSGLRFGLGDLRAIAAGFSRVEFGWAGAKGNGNIQIAGVSGINSMINDTVIHANDGTLNVLNNLVVANRSLTVFGDSIFHANLDVSTGTGGQTWNGAIDTQTFNTSFTGNRIDFEGGADSVSGSGTITIRPALTTTDIDVGNIIGAGGTPGTGLRFGLGDLMAIADGFTAVRFGYAGTGNHAIQVAGVNNQTGNHIIFDSPLGGAVTFLNTFRNNGFNLTVNGIAAASNSLEIFTGTGLQQYNGAVLLDTHDVTFTGNLVSFDGGAGSVTGSGNVFIRPATSSTDIDIGNVLAAGGVLGSGLRFGVGDLAALADGFSSVNFGYVGTGTHQMQIGDVTGASSFKDATFFHADGGSISILRNLNAVLDGSLHFLAPAGQIMLGVAANVQTAGAAGPNPNSGDVVFDGPVTVVSGGSPVINSGGNVRFQDTLNGSGGASLTVENAGTLHFGGDVDLDGGLTQISGGAGSSVELGGNITAASGNVSFESLVTLLADMLSITSGGAVSFGIAPFNIFNVVLDTAGFDFSVFAASVHFFGAVIGGGQFVLAPLNDSDAIDVGDVTSAQPGAFTVTNQDLAALAGVDSLVIGRASGAHDVFQVEDATFFTDVLLRSPSGGRIDLLTSLTNATSDAGIEIIGTNIHFGAGIFTNNGPVSITGPITLIGDSGVNTLGGTVNFHGTIDGPFGFDVIAIAGNRGNVNFRDVIGGITALTSLTVAGWDVLLSGIGTALFTGVSGNTTVTAQDDVIFQGGTYNANAQTYRAGDELRIDVVDTLFQTNGSDIQFGIVSTGMIGDTDGFQGIMLTSRPSLSIETGGGDIRVQGGIDATPGGVGLSNLVFNAGGGGIWVDRAIGATNRIGSVSFVGNTISSNTVRTNRAQDYTAGGGITLNGEYSTAVVGSGSLTFNGNVILGGATSVNSAGGALDSILIDGTLNGGFAFQANSGGGAITISDVIGGTTALASANIIGNTIELNGIGTVGGVGVTGLTTIAANDTLSLRGGTYTANVQTYAGGGGIFIDQNTIVRSTNDNITFISPVLSHGGIHNLTINSGTATITVAELGTEADGSDPVSPLLGIITLTGDEIDLNGAVYGASIVLQPFTNDLAINVGGSDNSTPALDLTAAEIALLAPNQPGLGLGSITIGRSGGEHDITIEAITFFDPVTFRANGGGGSITVAGNIIGDDNASLSLDATGGSVFFDADILTTANDVTVRGNAVVRADSVVTTQGGNIHFVGTLNGFGSGFDFTLNAFNGIDRGNVNIEAPIGLSAPLRNLTLNGFDNALFRVGTDDTPGVLETLTLVAFDDNILNGFGYHAGQLVFAAGDENRIARRDTLIRSSGGPIAFNDGIIRLQGGNDVRIASHGGTINIQDGISSSSDAPGAGDVVIDAMFSGDIGGDVEIFGPIGAQFAIGMLEILGQSIRLDGSVTTALSQTYTGHTSIGGGSLTSLDSGRIDFFGDVTLLDDLAVTTAGANNDHVRIFGTLMGDFNATFSLGSADLTITGETNVNDFTFSGDDVSFGDDFFGVNVQINGGSGGDISFGGSVTIKPGTGAQLNVIGNNVTLTGVVTTPENANASFNVGSLLDILVGANMLLGGDFIQSGAGSTRFAASAIEAEGDISFLGALSLLNNARFEGDNLTFFGTINSSGAARVLNLIGEGTIILQGALGNLAGGQLASLTVDRRNDDADPLTRIGAGITTLMGQSFLTRTQVFGPASLTAGGDVTFSNQLLIDANSPTNIMTDASAVFNGIVSSQSVLSVAADQAVTFAADVATTGSGAHLNVSAGADDIDTAYDPDVDSTRIARFQSDVTVGGNLNVGARGGIAISGNVSVGGDVDIGLTSGIVPFPSISVTELIIADYLDNFLPTVHFLGQNIFAGGDIRIGVVDGDTGRVSTDPALSNLLRFPIGPTVIFGNPQAPDASDTPPTFTVTGSSFELGRYERTTVHGNLVIDLLGGGNPNAEGGRNFAAGDLNVLGTMRVDADSLHFLARPRALTAVINQQGRLVLVTEPDSKGRNDVGSDWVILGILGANNNVQFSDTLLLNIGGFDVDRPTSDSRFSISLPGGRGSLGGNSLEGVTVFSPIGGTFTRANLAFPNPLAEGPTALLSLDIEGSGQGENPARAIAGAIAAANQLGQLPEPSSSPIDANEVLEILGIQLIEVPPDQLIEALVGWALYNDIGSTQDPSVAKISNPRVELTLVNRVIDAYRTLFLDREGRPRVDEVRRGINLAELLWLDISGSDDFDPVAFSIFLSTHGHEVIDDVGSRTVADVAIEIEQLRDLLDLVKLLGLTSGEYEVAKNRILGMAMPTSNTSITADTFQALILGPGRNPVSPAQAP
ncbi:MAG: filamentous hemagglutinin N-terminal domain-containing protein [Phycisphaeraceae bacterium]|nr:filamentous hemagglutinin N-terminal domain-containing protein [Phycisphaeraceae bacterium]